MIFEGKKLLFVGLTVLGAVAAVAGLTGVQIADANQCAAQCYAQEQACLQATRGSRSCSQAATRCLQSCNQR